MTITLHWWYVPVLLGVGALFFWWKAEHADNGCLSGIGEMFTAVALASAAVFFLFGHFL